MNKHVLIENLPLVNSDYKIPLSLLLYVFTIYYGRKYMINRQPYNFVRKIIPIYNFSQIMANIFLICFAFKNEDFLSKTIQNLNGRTIQDEDYKLTYQLFGYCWCLLKVSDFLDTLFFILMKKNLHVSFLHVYHHSTTMIVAYVSSKYLLLEQCVLYGGVNSLIHIFMYTYYMLTSLGFKPKWKKTVTILQLIQFITLMIFTFILSFYQEGKYLYFSVYSLLQCVMYIYLFGRFYRKAYSNVCLVKTYHED